MSSFAWAFPLPPPPLPTLGSQHTPTTLPLYPPPPPPFILQVSFVFSCQVVGKQIEGEAALSQPDATPDSPLLSQPRPAPSLQQHQLQEEERRLPAEAADAAAPREADTRDKQAGVRSSGPAMRRAQKGKKEDGISCRAPRDSGKKSAVAAVAHPRRPGGDCSSGEEEGMDGGGGALVVGSATPPESPCGASSPSRLGCSEEENEDSDPEDGNYGRRGFFTSQAAGRSRGGGGGGGGGHLGSNAAPVDATRKAPEVALRSRPTAVSAPRQPLGSLSRNRPLETPSACGGPASAGMPAASARVRHLYLPALQCLVRETQHGLIAEALDA